MNPRRNSALTLIELIIAIVLFSVIVMTFFSIDLFSRRQVLSSSRLAEVQNNASYVLDHMTKHISEAVGRADEAVQLANSSGVQVWVDDDKNGQLTSADYVIRYDNTFGFRYFPDFTNDPATWETLSDKITNFDSSGSDNYVYVTVTACWDPDGSPYACGTVDNPQVEMHTRIIMPSVTAN